MSIHPTAMIEAGAVIHPEADIGPHVYVGPNVTIGAYTRIKHHAHITGWTAIGEGNLIFSGAVLGEAPQDVAYQGEETYLRIGRGNTIREYVTIHRGTAEKSATIIGSHNVLMVNAHVAHNCVLGNHVVMVNGALLAGHVHVDDHAFLGGLSAVHQFSHIGKLVMVAGHAPVNQDVPPFMMLGRDGLVKGLNRVGLRRHGMTDDAIRVMKRCHQIFYREKLPIPDAIRKIRRELHADVVEEFITFVENSRRGISRKSRERG